MQMKSLFLYLLFWTLSVAPLISVVSRPNLLSFAVRGLCRGLSPLQSPSFRFNRSCESLRLNPPPLTPFSKATGLARDLAVIPLCAQLPLISVGPLELLFNIKRR